MSSPQIHVLSEYVEKKIPDLAGETVAERAKKISDEITQVLNPRRTLCHVVDTEQVSRRIHKLNGDERTDGGGRAARKMAWLALTSHAHSRSLTEPQVRRSQPPPVPQVLTVAGAQKIKAILFSISWRRPSLFYAAGFRVAFSDRGSCDIFFGFESAACRECNGRR